MIQLRGGVKTCDPRLGHIPEWDDRSNAYLLRDVLPWDKKPRAKSWGLTSRLDQGQEGSCVGHGWAQWFNSAPKQHGLKHTDAVAIYKRAQELDEWAGSDYDGTSCLAGAKASKEKGLVKVYRWAKSLDDILLGLSWEGAVVMATSWYYGMYDADADGYVRVAGKPQGGHCYILRRNDPKHERALITNSWGRSWGIKGDAWITYKDLERLFDEDGQACLPTEK